MKEGVSTRLHTFTVRDFKRKIVLFVHEDPTKCCSYSPMNVSIFNELTLTVGVVVRGKL